MNNIGIINTGSASGTNWWLWGTIILVGALSVGAVVFSVWSHQTNATNMADNTATSLNNLNNTINDVNRVNITLKSQMDLNSITTREYIKNINEHFDLIEKNR